jgi:hypothetical protein
MVRHCTESSWENRKAMQREARTPCTLTFASRYSQSCLLSEQISEQLVMLLLQMAQSFEPQHQEGCLDRAGGPFTNQCASGLRQQMGRDCEVLTRQVKPQPPLMSDYLTVLSEGKSQTGVCLSFYAPAVLPLT